MTKSRLIVVEDEHGVTAHVRAPSGTSHAELSLLLLDALAEYLRRNASPADRSLKIRIANRLEECHEVVLFETGRTSRSDRERIITALRADKSLTPAEIAEETELPLKTTHRHLKELLAEKRVKRVRVALGLGRGGAHFEYLYSLAAIPSAREKPSRQR